MLLLLGGAAHLLPAQSTALPAREIDDLLAAALAPVGERGPGLAVYVRRGEAAPYARVRGLANLEYGVPLTDRSVFDLASLAKQFTGLAVARLVAAGELRLTDDVRTFLPEVPDFGTPITIAHLLYHTSGLRDVGELHRVGNFGGAFTAATALRIVARQEGLNFPPGTEHEYSNTGYVLLALVVERVSGRSFPDYCRTHVFGPRGMDDSFANGAPGRLVPGRAVAYYGTEGDFTFDQANGMSLIGSSAVYASLRDLIAWTEFIADSDDPLRQLMTTEGTLADGTPVGYGFGLRITEVGGRPAILHSGSTPAGFRTLLAHFPGEELSLVILSNWGDLDPGGQLARPLLSLLLPDDTAAAPAPAMVAEPAAAAPVAVPAAVLEGYVGDYLFNEKRPVTITREGERLVITLAGRDPVALDTRSATEFFLPPLNSTLTFVGTPAAGYRADVREGDRTVGTLTPAASGPRFAPPPGAPGTYYSPELDQALTLAVRADTLYLVSGAHGESPLVQVAPSVFTSPAGHFDGLHLLEPAAGASPGFVLDLGSRARALRFYRQSLTE